MDHMAAPGAHFAPAVQDRNFLEAVRNGALDVLVKFTEFIADLLHIVQEVRELHRQLQIAAVADTVDGFAQDGSAGGHPVVFCLFDRISAFAEDIREEIREQTAFGIFDARDIADQTQRGSVSDAADYRIQAESLEFFHKWFGADPVVAQEHHGFFSVFVGDVHHLTDDLCHFTALECLEVLVFFAGDPVLVVVITLVDDVFRANGYPDFLSNCWRCMG